MLRYQERTIQEVVMFIVVWFLIVAVISLGMFFEETQDIVFAPGIWMVEVADSILPKFPPDWVEGMAAIIISAAYVIIVTVVSFIITMIICASVDYAKGKLLT